MACSSFEEMLVVCRRTLLKPVDHISERNIKANLDFEALRLAPPNSPDGYLPNVTIGDGNCIPRSISTLLYGTETHHLEIRVRIIYELVSNKSLYLNPHFLAEGSKLKPETVVSHLFF